MPNVVFDASSLVGALLKQGSIPERALLLARARDTICLSFDVIAEIREVFLRPKFRPHLPAGGTELILDVLTAAARTIEPTIAVNDCRDAKDNKYLELALAGAVTAIIASERIC
ncbi:MAG TPA: putative toxin-antitoxin system toxin component, PIN family [Stellaceae bacterium]|jgi:putative PIN family toxin of toxin-antitoxin system|nr:putative toxin-antitoxin system toxin component, PIN family [Stellaceae bacterium]